MDSDPKKSMTIGSFLKKGHILFGSYKCCFFWRTLDHLRHEKKKTKWLCRRHSFSFFPRNEEGEKQQQQQEEEKKKKKGAVSLLLLPPVLVIILITTSSSQPSSDLHGWGSWCWCRINVLWLRPGWRERGFDLQSGVLRDGRWWGDKFRLLTGGGGEWDGGKSNISSRGGNAATAPDPSIQGYQQQLAVVWRTWMRSKSNPQLWKKASSCQMQKAQVSSNEVSKPQRKK